MNSLPTGAETPQYHSRCLTLDCGAEFSLPHLSLFPSGGKITRSNKSLVGES
jgi:hypothetical protein